MTDRVGSSKELRASAVYAVADTWYACTNPLKMGAGANAVLLKCTSATASPGNVSFYVATSGDYDADTGTGTFFELGIAGESPKVFGPVIFSAAGQYREIIVPGVAPNEWVQVYFKASANATTAKLAVFGYGLRDDSTANISTNVNVSDIEIGAVEIKNAATDDRALVSDANTARAATDHVLEVQTIDAAGNVLGRTAANTARTTATLVDPSQIVDATGKVQPAGEIVTNSVFVAVGDNVKTATVITQDAAFGTASNGFPLFGKYQAAPTTYTDGDAAPILLDTNGRVVLSSDIEIGAVELKNGESDDRALISDANTARAATDHVLSTQPIDAAGNVLGRTAANTARTTGTLVDPVQIVDAAGNVVNVTAANTARTTATLTLPTQPIDEAGNVLGRTAANTARTTATLVNPAQIVDAAGNVVNVTAANTARTTATLVLPSQPIDEAAPGRGRAPRR